MKMPSQKNLFVIAALLLGAILVVAGLAMNAADRAPSPVESPSVTLSPTESVKTSSLSPRANSTTSSPSRSTGQPSKIPSSKAGPTEKPSESLPSGTVSTDPADRSTCPVTTDGTTKCPEDPYCPGGEFCEGDYGDPAAVPSDWWGSDN